MGRTGIYACGESVRRRNSLESVALFSLKQEAPASIGGRTFTVSTGMVLTKLIVIAVLGAVMIPYWNLANVGAFPNMNDFGAVNAVYASFFKKTLPARSCVEIGKLPMNGDVEVEVVAYCK